jgi:hypothetical protein
MSVQTESDSAPHLNAFIYTPYKTTQAILPVTDDLLRGKDSIELGPYITDISWSHSTTSPYSEAKVSVLVPIDLIDEIGFGYYDKDREEINLHASAYLMIAEFFYVEGTKDGDLRVVFTGPITGLTLGFKVDKKLGLGQTVPITFTASTWLMPLMRGFIVSGKEGLDIGESVIPYKKWQKISRAVFESASQDGLTEALKSAWEALGKETIEAVLFGRVLVGPRSGNEYYRFLKDEATLSTAPQESADVYGRNLSQLQPPPVAGSLWGVIQGTFQASPLIELFPLQIHATLRREGKPDFLFTEYSLVYRLRPLHPRIAENHTEYLKKMGLKGQDMDEPISFVPTTEVPRPLEAKHVLSYDLSYSDARNNYIEVTSPYTGSTPLAGISCDPLYHEGDIKVYGLFRVSVPYPYIRSKDDSDQKIRDEMNELTKYASLLYSFDHKYASGTLTTKYMWKSSLSHGDWVRWRQTGKDRSFYTGYITKVTHSLRVNELGVLEGTSTYNVERTDLAYIPRGEANITDD